MTKILTVGCNLERLSEVNGLFRAHGYPVRGADCRSTLRHLLSLEPFQYVVVLDQLPLGFSEALRNELRAGRSSPRVVEAHSLNAEEVVELFTLETEQRRQAA